MSATQSKILLSPTVLQWARERASLSVDELAQKLQVEADQVADWESSGEISTKLIASLAQKTYTPLGFLYLPEPPDDTIPIQDFRTSGAEGVGRSSPNLLDTVYSMLRRQDWMREELISEGEESLPFVQSETVQSDVEVVARRMRETLGMSTNWAQECRTWADASRLLRDHIETAGILVAMSGVVGTNNHRKLDRNEFRGFALVDEYAPLVFVNSTDYQVAQTFTLMHECAHLWLGASGVSNLERLYPSSHAIERWCNAVAGEFLVPRTELSAIWGTLASDGRIEVVARRFKVSRVVAARRARDLNLIDQDTYIEIFDSSKDAQQPSDGGGNFWNNQTVRIGRRFGTAVVRAALEGRLMYGDAYRLTDLRGSTFDKFARRMGY